MADQGNKDVNKKSSLPAMEEEILNFWEKNKIFEKSLEKNKKDYVFYDGPPFATGTPHYGHIVASLMKDVVPRYWTMKGFRVERKWGWDCHGLPIENIVEKEMKFKSKKEIIEKLGVAKFNEVCRSKVLSYVDEWEKVIRRLGRWADMKNAYRTMDLDYMESIWAVFKNLWDKGLIYKDYRSMHICPRCETTLSQSEVAEGYKMVKDLSVIAKFELRDEPGTYFLAWTTTPWTLIGNVALAVGKDIEYAIFEKTAGPNVHLSAGEKIIFAEGDITSSGNVTFFNIFGKNYYTEKNGKYISENGEEYERKELVKGKDLVGKKYKPLFDYYSSSEKLENRENGWKVYAGDFVTTEEGTGIVHIAPAFGEDDMNLAKENKLPFVQHVGMDGVIRDEAKDFSGLHVKPIDDVAKTDVEIIKYLAHNNLLFSKEKYEHSYPHCWRCDTPLLNYATSSWFVNITKIKPKMLKLAKKINWVPEHIKDGRFGNWLEGARDWSISRQRFWASVIPIWECSCGERKVIGSVEELEKLSGEKVNDLHKHIVDEITFPCSKCKGEMKRVPDVLDTWFDSGSMPYAQMHYPFENKKKFEDNFPAEFIAEGVDQTRAWFYYLHVVGTAMKEKNAFNNVIVNGIVLAEDGKKMSKRLQNYPDPMEILNKYGADPLRYYLCASPVMKADNINFSEKDLSEQTRFFNILLNVLSFYKMFAVDAKIENLEKKDLVNVLDKWITARLEETKKIITEKMDNYDLQSIREIPIFINDLSTWYVRRSRDRFKGDDELDKMRALKTLRRTLYHLARIMAPFLPFTAEHIYQELGADVESVHLKEWPEVRKEWIDEKVLAQMSKTKGYVEIILACRDKYNLKVKQPLRNAIIAGNLDDEYKKLISEECNIRNIISPPFDRPKGENWKISEDKEITLDTEITPELKMEGIKRELVRAINNLRKEAGMTIQDKAAIYYNTDNQEIRDVFEKFGEEIKKDTLSNEIHAGGDGKKVKVNGEDVSLDVKNLKL
ncbi:MAG: isoleucine--tRNA ligase [Patescibacteria group bacterium]